MWVGDLKVFLLRISDISSRISKSFLVIIPRGSHPFPSRTRKLSLAGPMILHGQLCGNVGRRRDLYSKGRSEQSARPFAFGEVLFQVSRAPKRFPQFCGMMLLSVVPK